MPTPLTLKFSIELDYWKRQDDVTARRSSGRTSIRVSKSTLIALRALAEKVRAIGSAEKKATGYSWMTPTIAPDALLLALARGHVAAGHASASDRSTRSRTPAKKTQRKSAKRSTTKKRSTKRATSRSGKRHASSRARKVRR